MEDNVVPNPTPPEAQPEPGLEPAAVPPSSFLSEEEPAPAPAPAPESEPAPAPEPAAVHAPAPEPAAVPAPVPAPEETPAPEPAKKRKVKPWVWAVIAAVVVIAAIGIGLAIHSINQSKAYDEAIEAYDNGDYAQAAEGFEKLGNYQDAPARYEKANQWVTAKAAEESAKNKQDAELWAAASEAYSAIGESDADDASKRCSGNADYYTGLGILSKSPTDLDAVKKALPLFENCTEIADASDQVSYCENVIKYYDAKDLLAQGHYYDAYKKFDTISSAAAEKLGDVSTLRDSCIQPLPSNGAVWHNSDYSDSCQLKIVNAGNPNAYYKLYFGDTLVITAFIAAGEEAEFMLPAGVYSMNKGYGDIWFGIEDMFGDEGSYYKCSFGESNTVELVANNGYEISTGGEGTGIDTQSARRGAI